MEFFRPPRLYDSTMSDLLDPRERAFAALLPLAPTVDQVLSLSRPGFDGDF